MPRRATCLLRLSRTTGRHRVVRDASNKSVNKPMTMLLMFLGYFSKYGYTVLLFILILILFGECFVISALSSSFSFSLSSRGLLQSEECGILNMRYHC